MNEKEPLPIGACALIYFGGDYLRGVRIIDPDDPAAFMLVDEVLLANFEFRGLRGFSRQTVD